MHRSRVLSGPQTPLGRCGAEAAARGQLGMTCNSGGMPGGWSGAGRRGAGGHRSKSHGGEETNPTGVGKKEQRDPPAPPPRRRLTSLPLRPAGSVLARHPNLVRAFASAAAQAEPILDNTMFCYQCEQTKSGTGCTVGPCCGRCHAALHARLTHAAYTCALPSLPAGHGARPNQPAHPFALQAKGVCGKTPEVNFLQDLLTYSLKGLSCWADFAAKQGVEVPQQVRRQPRGHLVSMISFLVITV